MSLEASSFSSAEDLLQAFAVNTMALDAVVIELAQAERALVARVQARAAGLSVQDADTTDLALRLAGERMPGLVQVHERLGRSLRLTLALKRRIETGWPRRGEADDRRAMARRQVEQAVGARIRAEFDEPAERLRLLEERLWDPGLEAMLDSMPVEAVIAEIGRALTAVGAEVTGWGGPAGEETISPTGPHSEFVAPDPHPALPGHSTGQAGPRNLGTLRPLPQGEREQKAPRGWPAGMVNPPPHEYERWLDRDEGRRRGGRQPDD